MSDRGSNSLGRGSGGISIKNVLTEEGRDGEEPHGFSVFLDENYMNTDDPENSCCFGACHKQRSCGGRVPCGVFKNKVHGVFCTFFTIMIVALFTSVIGPLVLYQLADESINEQVVIDSKDAPSYKPWQTNTKHGDTKIMYDLYYFDVQNAQGVLNGEKPVVTEIGPYAFHEYYYKFDISWKDDGNKVSYNAQKYYIFDAERTGPGLSLDDQLTLPYPSVIGFEYLLGMIPEAYSDMLEVGIINKIKVQELALEAQFQEIYDTVDAQFLPPRIKTQLLNELHFVNMSIHTYFDDLYSFINQSSPANLLLKTMLCGLDSGLSPFWEVDPFSAWFGWLHDPLLEEVQLLLNEIQAQTGQVIPWSTAVPGAAVNYTSVEDTRRRRSNDLQYTGKQNKNEIAQYIRYNNMSSYWVCIAPMDSQNPDDWDPATQFPACTHFQNDWTVEEAEEAGYVQPFATPYANRIEGTDANMFGRPLTSNKVQVFISDIYRSAYMIKEKDVDWHGVTLHRMGLQEKDLYNYTQNPENAQYFQFGPMGVENATQASGIPVFVSFPHFLYGADQLQAAVTGLDANPEIHSSYLDLEPQTGMLVRAEKKLQVNYLMEDYYLPSTAPDSLAIANGICANISGLISALQSNGIDTGNITDVNCTLDVATPLLTCWSIPSDWKLSNGGSIYFPYGYADEHMSLDSEDAEDLKNTLYFIDSLAGDVQFWCLMIAGICFTVQAAIVVSAYFEEQNLAPYLREKRSGGNVREPLLAASDATTKKQAADPTNQESYSFGH